MTTRLPEFDELLALARRDPRRLEKLRLKLVEQLIDDASDDALKQRLRGLQSRIDLERQRCKTPMSACVRLCQLMHDSLLELRQSLQTPLELQQQRQQRETATIVNFKPRSKLT